MDYRHEHLFLRRTPTPAPRRRRRAWFVVFTFIALLFIGSVAVLRALEPPRSFPIDTRIEIPFGTTLLGAARIMHNAEAVHSALLLQVILIGSFGEDGVRAGTYQFTQPMTTYEVARALSTGTHGVPLLRFTIPEGLRNEAVDTIVADALPHVSPGEFTQAANGLEGYLFPETYHVPETYTAKEVVGLMSKTFSDVMAERADLITASGRTEEDIIIMASIIEREADTDVSMRLVADILWRRIDINMPLQVDASFSYLLGKTSAEVTLSDLAFDSPYNTYRYRGLPPTPLNNPGAASIDAALKPTPSKYLFYLTAPDGTFYYAETFEEHDANVDVYLRN